MYCVNCGVKLKDTELECPLCNTRVYHPDIVRKEEACAYPEGRYPSIPASSYIVQVIITAMFVLPLLIVVICDMQFNNRLTWSGYVVGALLVAYIVFVLPLWFKKINPIIIVPFDFIAMGLYLFYINEATSGKWFVSLALPAVVVIGAIVTTVVSLLWYLKRGRLHVIGGAMVVMGLFVVLFEFLMITTFEDITFKGWSLYPLVTFVVIGGVLIFLGICSGARETMERKFFI